MASDRGRLFLVDDAGPETMAHVGGDGIDLAFVAIEPHREVLAVFDPEVAVEVLLQRLGPLAQRGRQRAVARLGRAVRTRDEGRVDVALDFAERDGRLRERAVREARGIPRVLPT